MTAKEIKNMVLLFPNTEWTSETVATLNSVRQLRASISYAQDLFDDMQTLSSHNTPASALIQGFLYVPSLLPDDPCVNISKQYIPNNVTRRANLPPTDFTLVAVAPWISVECTLGYLTAANMDPARGFIFYLPNNDTSKPPLPSSPDWDLNDGGRWKTITPYPVYAVPGAIGTEMIYELTMYSGNMTAVPFGHEISELPNTDPRDYVRIFTQITVSTTSSLPSLWVFLLIIAAVSASMLAAISAAMHLIQRRRRRSLRRRVERGEVNLEALGIKRLTVPQEVIDSLPLFTYNCEGEKSLLVITESKNVGNTTTGIEQYESGRRSHGSDQDVYPAYDEVSLLERSVEDNTSNPNSALVHKFLPYSQPTCPICLDDFESGLTPIRELPCGHIFHPECIDAFLGNNSSLCPMCKDSVLPIGYCPAKITNNMVRRERNVRRLRSRVTINVDDADVQRRNGRNRMQYWGTRFGRRIMKSSTSPNKLPQMTSSMPLRHQTPAVMTSALPPHPQIMHVGNGARQHRSGLSREEIALQRIQELVGGLASIEDSDVINGRPQSKWRRMLSKAFPGFS